MKWVSAIFLIMLLSACAFEPEPVIEHREVQVDCPVPNKNTTFLYSDSIDVTSTKIKS